MLRPEGSPVPSWFIESIEAELRPWLDLSPEKVARLYKHYDLLQTWNKKISLTTVRPGVESVRRHYCESIFFGLHFPGNPEQIGVADVGSGPGFPGIPIAILKPAWKVTLIESNQRKAVFLREATRGLHNVSVVARRAEEVFDLYSWVVSRAVNPSDVLKNVPRLAQRVGLMLGEDDFSTIKSSPNIAWAEPLRLPWGDRRICVYGHCFT